MNFFVTPAAFRSWLAAHHASARELIVGFHKVGSGKPSMTWPESVDEALCFGWIDGVRRSAGPDAYAIRFTPRKPTSIWSAVNVAKVDALRAAGKMTAAGEAAFARRTAARTGVYSFERAEPAALSPAHAAQLAAHPEAARHFAAQPPWYQRTALHWIVSAAKEDTRDRRLAALIASSAAGQPLAHLDRAGAAKATTPTKAPVAKPAKVAAAKPAGPKRTKHKANKPAKR